MILDIVLMSTSTYNPQQYHLAHELNGFLSVHLHDPIEDTKSPSFNDCPRGPLQEAAIWPEYDRRVLTTKNLTLICIRQNNDCFKAKEIKT
jgi:hypothetical protein